MEYLEMVNKMNAIKRVARKIEDIKAAGCNDVIGELAKWAVLVDDEYVVSHVRWLLVSLKSEIEGV